MALEKSVKRNYIYNLGYQLLAVVTPLVTAPYISRVLGADLIGIYSYTFAITGYFATFGALGTNTYGQLLVSKNRDDRNALSIAFNNVFWAKCLTMSISILLYVIYILLVKENTIVYTILLMYLVSGLVDITWFFQGIEEFGLIVTRNTIIRLTSVILIFILVKSKEDIYIYIAVLMISGLLGNLSLWMRIRRYISFRRPDIKTVFMTIKENSVYFIPSIATVVFVSLDKCMIGWITTGSLENGYYEQANKIYSIIVAFVTSLTVVVLPRVSYLFNNRTEQDSTYRFINRNISYILMITIPMGVGLFSIASKFVPLFFGDGFEQCIPIIRVFSAIIIFTSLNSIIANQCLVANGLQNVMNRFLVISSVINTICNFFLIRSTGALGAALASCISEGCLLFMLIIYNKKIVKIVEFARRILKYAFLSMIMSIAMIMVNMYGSDKVILNLVEQIGVGGVLYLILLGIARDDLFFSIVKSVKIKR